ncbi:LysR family transcriptional regulator [Salinisphaera hydrothermalis]|uniref:LysR family transcriptional regulator n=1 Tax=Salinisphaera hydrothermalis TaxID=563188 RepID=UPI0018DE5351|nr:LysR family transcriptional regulator [Salinisphaera hydrothermalis]
MRSSPRAALVATLFVSVAETGSFSLAAQRMHTVQSNVTAHVKKLERELSVALFQRNGKVGLTSAGHRLLSHARRTLAAQDDALAVFRDSNTPSGVRRIGSMETTTADVRLPRS